MKPDLLTNEFLSSSDFDDIVSLNKCYTLGVGYCYVKQVVDLFKANNKLYRFFDVKWGRCGTTYLFSALNPADVLVITAWQNSAITCNHTDTLFRVWRAILSNLASIDVPMTVFEMPAAWHRSCHFDMLGTTALKQHIQSRTSAYRTQVVEPSLGSQVQYIDLATLVSEDSPVLLENVNDQRGVSSPWHAADSFVQLLGQFHIDKLNQGVNTNDFETRLFKYLKENAYE